MRLRRNIIVALCLAVSALAAIVGLVSKAAAPVDMSVVSVAESESTKLVTVEFRRCNPGARFAEAHRLQLRIAGRWQPPVSLPEFRDGYLLARTNNQRMIFAFPHQTEACRFLLGYRVDPRPVGRRLHCQVYCFLERHGLSKRFPKFSRTVLRWVPQRSRLRQVECELMVSVKRAA